MRKIFDQIIDKIQITILSIDGGGVKGYYQAKLLKLISEELNVDLIKYFDLMIGTSTGAIITTSLLNGLSTSDIHKLYYENVPKIFTKTRFNVGGVYKSKYDPKILEKVLKKYFGTTKLEATPNLYIPAIEITKGQNYIFSAINYPKLPQYRAVMASCAAPSIFPPYKIRNKYFIDGGLWINNPSVHIILQKLHENSVRLGRIKILSIGSVKPNPAIIDTNQKNGNRWGLANWNKKIIDILLDYQSFADDQFLDSLLTRDQYLRINHSASPDLNKIDGVKDLEKLDLLAEEAFAKNRKKLVDFFNV